MPEATRSTYNNKIKIHPSTPIAWGSAGNYTIGNEWFSNWLRNYDFQGKDLISFQIDVASSLSKLNGEQRKLIVLSGAEVAPSDLAEVIIVGYLDEPFIFTVDDRGVVSTYDKEQLFHAIGSGGSHAVIANTTVSIMNNDFLKNSLTPNAILNITMLIASNKAKNCEPPIHIYRITEFGVENVSNK
jgi:hypothetical protein